MQVSAGFFSLLGSPMALGREFEIASLLWKHPLSFILFSIAVPLLLLGGIAMFLLSLVRETPQG